MGSRASLLALSVIAAALGALVALGGGPTGPRGRVSTRVLPDFEPSRAQRLAWRRAGAREVVVERGPDGWRLIAPVRAPTSPAAIADVLGTLELLSYRRRADGEPIGETRYELDVDGTVLRFGDDVPQMAQAFVAAGDRTLLIDAYAASALDRRVDDLRARLVFEMSRSDLTGLELHAGDRDAVLSGRPLMLHLDGGGTARADPEVAARLVDDVLALRVERFVDVKPPDDQPSLSVRAIGGDPRARLHVFGACPDGPELRLADATVGTGCVAAAAVDEIAAAVGADLLDLHLFRFTRPARIAIGELELERRGTAWWLDADTRADTAAVDDWLDAVDAITAEPIGRPAAPIAGIAVAIDGQRVSIDPASRRAQREGEPIAFRLSDATPFTAAALQFRDRTIIAEEPLGLAEATRGDEHITRGESHDDWKGAGADPARLDAIRAFRAAAARLRAERFTNRPLRGPTTAIDLTFDPPPGETEPHHYRIEIDRTCHATASTGDDTFVIAAATCAALRARWR